MWQMSSRNQTTFGCGLSIIDGGSNSVLCNQSHCYINSNLNWFVCVYKSIFSRHSTLLNLLVWSSSVHSETDPDQDILKLAHGFVKIIWFQLQKNDQKDYWQISNLLYNNLKYLRVYKEQFQDLQRPSSVLNNIQSPLSGHNKIKFFERVNNCSVLD